MLSEILTKPNTNLPDSGFQTLILIHPTIYHFLKINLVI